MGRKVVRCMCEWPDSCGGTGMLHCEGCGGDLCICKCSGEKPCPGCEECEFDERGSDPDGWDEEGSVE